MEFTVLNSPKGFWRSLPEISLSFLTPNYLRPDYQSIGALLLCIRKAECLASRSQTFHSLSDPVLLVTQANNLIAFLKYLLSIKSKGLNCIDGTFQVCGATGDLSFATNERSNK